MEFFGARPGVPIETCLAEVRRSDILVVIVGHRYGSLVPSIGISFSEAEYEEGFRLRKPCLVYMLDEDVPVLPKNIERDADKARQLDRWKNLLRERHTVAKFTDGHDLAVRVAADLGRTMQAVEESAQSQSTADTTASDIKELLGECEALGFSRERALSTLRRALINAGGTDRDRWPTVFLSHSHVDKKIVRDVADRLRANDVRVWIDEAELRTGDSLIHTIEHGLDSSDFVAFFISRGSLNSRWARQELNVAMSRQVSGQGQAVLLPILLDDVEIPPLLRDVMYCDLRDGNVDRAASQLIDAIRLRRTRDRGAQSSALAPRGGNFRAFLNLTLDHTKGVKPLERILKGIPEVVEVTLTYGSVDLVAILAVENIQQINAIVEVVQKVPGVKITSTLIGTS